jgi:hypothetical protein
MKTLCILMVAFALLGLAGCATKEPAPEKSMTLEPVGQKISAYFYAAYENNATVEAKLASAGFEIVATYSATKESETIIITNDALKTAADKPGRGFGAILRVLIDNKNHRIAVTNPVYFGKAFFQKEFDYALAKKLTEALNEALGEMTASPDVSNFDDLASYRFMIGMPTYKDTYLLGEGDDASLLAKLNAYKNGEDVVFTLPLGEGRTLVGFNLDKKTNGFVSKIGTQNAEVLPYTILIEEGKATALKVEYYIAISYPMLSMGQFMTIATLPGAVERELEKPFKP